MQTRSTILTWLRTKHKSHALHSYKRVADPNQALLTLSIPPVWDNIENETKPYILLRISAMFVHLKTGKRNWILVQPA
jgi:hypothetical protein